MTPVAFRDLAIVAIERQIAAGSRLVWDRWGLLGDDGAPLSCGCAVALVIQDADPAAAREVVRDSSSLDADDVRVAAAHALGLTPKQVDQFIAGFDGRGECTSSWHLAGMAVAHRFASVLLVSQ